MGRNPNHLSRTQSMSFFKVMFGDFSKHLHIPPVFAKHYDVFFPQDFVLRTRDGEGTRVGVIKVKDKLYIKAGWSNFVQYNSLDLGDFLVFKKVGDLELNVSIYKRRTGCEEGVTIAENESNTVESDSESDCFSDRADKIRETRSKVTDEFSSKLPFFKVTMTNSYINRSYLHIPNSFSKKYLCHKNLEQLILKVANKSWAANVNDHSGHCRLSMGWGDFVRDNLLQEDDVCAFELLEGKETVLKVTILGQAG